MYSCQEIIHYSCYIREKYIFEVLSESTLFEIAEREKKYVYMEFGLVLYVYILKYFSYTQDYWAHRVGA